jgi:hypothetical protein
MKEEKLIFVEEDVKNAPNLLSKIIRKIFVKRGIRCRDFKYHINRYLIDKRTYNPTLAECTYLNYLKVITNDNHRISWKTFNKILEIIGLPSLEDKFPGIDNIVDNIVNTLLF